MKSDYEIQMDVMDQLKWDPLLTASEIGVSVKNGVVTLSGIVDSYAKKTAAEKAALKVYGVRAVAEDIQVGSSAVYNKTDAEIANAVINALRWHSSIPEENIKVKVENGFVTLEGEVDWEFQRSSAKIAVTGLNGVKNVFNKITVKTKPVAADIKQKISAALQRAATVDAQKVTVEVSGNKVILRGNVRSYAEKQDAEEAAWCAPGVTSVESHLVIAPQPEFVI